MKPLVKRNGGMPSLFQDFFGNNPLFKRDVLDFDMDLSPSRLGINVPTANVTETAKEYRVELAAPGLDRKDFNIEFEEQTLKISAEKETEEKEEKEEFSRREYSFNSFMRSFYIPQAIKDDKIEAKYENGVLRITMPKQKETEAKPTHKIEVK